MRDTHLWLLASWLCACGGGGSNSQNECPGAGPEPACRVGVLSQTEAFRESAEELSRDEVEREKSLVTGCFAITAQVQCDFLPEQNVTRCQVEGNQYVDAMTFRVEWEDDACGFFHGDAIREQRGASTPPLLGHISKVGQGTFHIESVEDFGLYVTFTSVSEVGVGFTSGTCIVNLSDPRDASEHSSVSLCGDDGID